MDNSITTAVAATPAGKTLNYIRWAFIAIAAIALVAIVVSIYKAAKSGGNAVGNIIGDQTVSVQTGIDVNRVSFLRTIAYNLWENGVDLPFGSKAAPRWMRDYDEELFIKAINTCVNVKEASLLNEFYQQKSGEQLAQAIEASFDSSNKARCKQEILAFLLS